jgi:hypothetical protein
MPFSREYTKEFYIDNLRPYNIIWHPISEKKYDWPNEDWIQPFIYDKTDIEIQLIPFFALKKFLEDYKIIDDDYYFELSDDDFLEPDFINKLNTRRRFCDVPNSHINTNFIIVSLLRGHNMTTTSGYPTAPLIAHPDNMRLFWTSMSQIIIKGKIFKDSYLKYLETNHISFKPGGQIIPLDGLYIQYLWNTHAGSSFTFVPEAYQWFNYLEPGRWNKMIDVTFNDKYINIYNIKQK